MIIVALKEIFQKAKKWNFSEDVHVSHDENLTGEINKTKIFHEKKKLLLFHEGVILHLDNVGLKHFLCLKALSKHALRRSQLSRIKCPKNSWDDYRSSAFPERPILGYRDKPKILSEVFNIIMRKIFISRL